MRKSYFFLILICLISACAGQKDDFSVTTEDGREIQCTVYRPKAYGNTPALIIAPGSGYHRGLPLISMLGEEAAKRGFTAVTFDWGYFTAQTKPVAGYAAEYADIKAVTDHVKKMKNIDAGRIALAGKSFGSVIAYNHFLKDTDIDALLLLTPIIPDVDYETKLYPGLAEQERPITIILGADDADNCPLSQLYSTLNNGAKKIPAVVLPGDHGMNAGDYKDPAMREINDENINAAVVASLQWLSVMLKTY